VWNNLHELNSAETGSMCLWCGLLYHLQQTESVW